MCGILVTKNIEKIRGTLQHRGPDYQNQVTLNGFTFHHFRLAIQDTSIASSQPMFDEYDDCAMCYNGEIYNTEYLKQKYLKGVPLSTTGDSEIVFKLLQIFGPKICDQFDGIFAIVFMSNDKLFLIRDHFGVKPLYYYKKQNQLIISSEISIINYNTNREIDIEKIPEFIAYKYTGDASTPYKNVFKVSPGQLVCIDFSGEISSKHYFDVRKISAIDSDVTKEEFNEDFSRAISSQKVSDVPYGIQLSGGVDSTLIAAHFPSSTPTFSTVFENDYGWNERQYIDQVATSFQLSPKFIFYDDIYAIRSLYGSFPFSGGINHPHTFAIEQLAQYASKDVKILFSGEGADELFWGYDRYKHGISTDAKIVENSLFYNRGELNTLFNLDIKKAFQSRYNVLEKIDKNESNLSKLRKLEFIFHLENLLERYDLATMKYGIEGRVPFLSTNFAIKYLNLSHKAFVKSTGKFLLKEICGDTFSHNFAFRKKIGYRVPFNEFIYVRELDDIVNSSLSTDIVQEYLVSDVIQQIRQRHGVYSDIATYSKIVWTIINLCRL